MDKKHPYYDKSMWKGAPASSFLKAKQLRESMTEAERKLWEALQKPPLTEVKFRRQHPIHLYIVDFYCHSHRLIIEIDGKYHEEEIQKNADKERTAILNYQGLNVIRFTNEDILNNLDTVLEQIKEYLNLN